MAIETKDKQISAAAAVIKTAVDPNAAQTLAKQTIAKAQATLLKAQTDTRLQSEASLLAKLHGSDVVNNPNKPTDDELNRQRYMQLERNKYDLTNNTESIFSLTYESLANKTTLTQGEILFANPTDKRVSEAQVIEQINENGSRTYYTGKGLTEFLAAHPTASRTSGAGARASGVQPQSTAKDNFRISSIGEIQREMFEAIEIASQKTGVPAKLLGAMAGKETRFGQGQVSSSGAEGLFQQTDSYLIANYVITDADIKKNPARVRMVESQIKQIASVVPEAAEYMKDGRISLNEARRLAWNPTAAAMLTGLRAQALAKDLNLDLNNPSSWAYVYTEHNAGRGSLNNLLKGGMTEKWIQDLNPSMYKGASSANDVLQIAANDMTKWGDRYEKIYAASLASSTIAQASLSSKASLKPSGYPERHPEPA